MAFFRTVAFAETLPTIEGEGVTLRLPQMAEFEEWAALRTASRDFLTPWEPSWPADDLTRAVFIFRKQDNLLLGGLTLANVRRGVAQAGSIGYWLGMRFARNGYMTAAVKGVLPFCFETLRLHRVEAACIPTNTASIRLLERCGFLREGYARQYLCINGVWQDHLLFARLRDDAP
jgi:ribosomal-protein-alanine N-acetyltransferase